MRNIKKQNNSEKHLFFLSIYMKSLLLVTSDFFSTLKHVAEEPPLYRENNERREGTVTRKQVRTTQSEGKKIPKKGCERGNQRYDLNSPRGCFNYLFPCRSVSGKLLGGQTTTPAHPLGNEWEPPPAYNFHFYLRRWDQLRVRLPCNLFQLKVLPNIYYRRPLGRPKASFSTSPFSSLD